MPYQHGYNLRSSTARDQSSEHHLDSHQHQRLDNHQYNLRSSTARGQPSEHRLDNNQQHRSSTARGQPPEHRLDNRQQQHLDSHQQQHLDNHQHDPGFDYSSSSRSPETKAVSSAYDSGQDVLYAYDNEHDRRNNHHEYYLQDNINTSRNRDRNQSLLPDATAPFGYQLSVTGEKYPVPDPNEKWRVKELNGAYTTSTMREIENFSGYWSTAPDGTRYFHCTVPIEVCKAIRQSSVQANIH